MFMGFMPVMRTTRNILQTLQDFSNERKISSTLLEFEILAYETFILRPENQTYEKLDRDQILCEDELLDPLISIIQVYRIRIVPKEKYETISNINLSLAVDKFKTKAVVTIKAESVLVNHQWIIKEIRDAIWKKKVFGGFFIDFFEQNLIENIKKLVRIIPLDKPISQDIKFTVATAIEVQPPLDSRLVRVYETTQEEKNLIEGIQKDELILKYIKLKPGCSGRGCDGKFIKVRLPKELDPQPIVDNSIYFEENENEIDYFAAINGHVVFESDNFFITQYENIAT